MDEVFRAHVEGLRPSIEQLVAMRPVKVWDRPLVMPERGIYLLSAGATNLYARSNNIRKRLGRHCRPSSPHNAASFAFLLAREATDNLVATYTSGVGSRDTLIAEPKFFAAFTAAKTCIRNMDLRYVEETDPTRQALLEIYVAVVLRTPYNDFDTH